MPADHANQPAPPPASSGLPAQPVGHDGQPRPNPAFPTLGDRWYRAPYSDDPLPEDDEWYGDTGSDALVRPINQSGWAMLVGYCGLLGFIPGVSLLTLLFAALLAAELRRNPKRGGRARVAVGFALGAVFSLIWIVFLFVQA